MLVDFGVALTIIRRLLLVRLLPLTRDSLNHHIYLRDESMCLVLIAVVQGRRDQVPEQQLLAMLNTPPRNAMCVLPGPRRTLTLQRALLDEVPLLHDGHRTVKTATAENAPPSRETAGEVEATLTRTRTATQSDDGSARTCSMCESHRVSTYVLNLQATPCQHLRAQYVRHDMSALACSNH